MISRAAFQPHKSIGFNFFGGKLWVQLSEIYELIEIVRQNSDAEFAQALNKSIEVSHTDDDVREIKSATDRDTSRWPNGILKVCLTNRPANIENERCTEKLGTELRRDAIFIYAKDSARDIETQTLSVNISGNQSHKTGNLPGKLKVCITARVMSAPNIKTSDYLLSESTGKKEFMRMPVAGNNLVTIIDVKFDGIDAGNSLKIY